MYMSACYQCGYRSGWDVNALFQISAPSCVMFFVRKFPSPQVAGPQVEID